MILMIIFLNGSTNAGKSTIAHALCQLIPRSRIVEIDTLIAELSHLSPKLRLDNGIENGIRLIEETHRNGLHSIIPFPLSEAHYNYFMARLQTLSQITFFTLDPSHTLAMSNRGARQLTDKERQRITDFYALGLHHPSFGITLNTSRHTVQDTTNLILERLIAAHGADLFSPQ